MAQSRDVVFVGRRRAALEAARTLDLRVVCVAEEPLRRREVPLIAEFHRAGFSRPGTDWPELAGRISRRRRIRAVFGLTETAVLPAALLRRHLGVAGDSPECALRCTDKWEMKHAAVAAGIPCATFLDEGRPDDLVERLGLPLVLKAKRSSGGRRNRICRSREEVTALKRGWMAESFVDGVEMSVESLVVRGKPVFLNPTEYFRVRWANIVPAVLDPGVLREVTAFNARVLAALGIETAFTHIELFLTPERIVFGEIAARPPGGYITDLIRIAYGFDPWEAWLRLGLGEEVALPRKARGAAGAWILHPGHGVVKSVTGAAEARALPGVEHLQLSLRAGDAVSVRLGSGQEVGHLVVQGRDRDQVAERLSAAHAAIRLEMEERSP